MVKSDADSVLCCYELLGVRCHNYGVWSPAGSAKRYCKEHGRHNSGHEPAPPGTFERLRAIVAPKPVDAEADAERRAIQSEGSTTTERNSDDHLHR